MTDHDKRHQNWSQSSEPCTECDLVWLEMKPQTEFVLLSVPYHTVIFTGVSADQKPEKKGFEFL